MRSAVVFALLAFAVVAFVGHLARRRLAAKERRGFDVVPGPGDGRASKRNAE